MLGNAESTPNGHHRGDLQTQDLVAALDGIEHRLATQPVIEQAKGILMLFYGIDSKAAFAVLRRWSMNRNVKVHRLAGELVAVASVAHPARFDALRSFLQSKI